MFLRHKIRKKDGKRHRYWSVVENKRVAGGRVVQKHVLHRGEINDSQALAWRRSIEVVDEQVDRAKTLALFPEDRCEGIVPDASIVRLKLSALRLRRPRQWGACWLALSLWEELQLDRFWAERLPASRKGTRWDQELFVLVAYRLLAPGSEWRLHREWFERTALADLLGADFGLAEIHKLYRCHDRLLEHKEALFDHLTSRWRDLFNARFDLLLLRSDQHLFRGRTTLSRRRQAALRLFARSSARLRAGGDRAGDDPGGVAAGLRGPVRQHLGQDDAARLPRPDRAAIRQGAARLVDGSRHSDRRSAGRDETGRPAGAISGRNAEGAPEPPGAGPARPALARGEARRAGQAGAEGGRTLRLRPEPRQGRQGARNAQATIERAVGAAERPAPDVGQPVARRTAHQTRTSQSQGAGRMAPGRSRRRPGARRVRLCSRSQEVTAGASARRALSPAQQSYRRRPGDAMGLLPPTRPNRGSVSNPQRRPRRQADPSSRAMANRSAHLHRLSRLLPARHHRPPPESAGARPDPAQPVRKVRRRSNDRRPHPNHRRPRIAADPLHAARARADAAARTPQAPTAGPAAPQNHRRPSRRIPPRVVPTFRVRSQHFQRVNYLRVAETAKFGSQPDAGVQATGSTRWCEHIWRKRRLYCRHV